MKIKPQIKFSKIINFLKELLRKITKSAFLAFLILLFLALALGGFMFYRYSILAERAEPDVLGKALQFKMDTYKKILEEWEMREKAIEEVDAKEYSNPFQAVPFEPVE